MNGIDFPDFPPDAFARIDEIDDAEFYRPARLVTHIDDQAITALTQFYGETLQANWAVLDLMSSCVSHLPADLPLGDVIGLGMNQVELSANPRLTRSIVQNLNQDCSLPLGDASCDAALCCVSVQYLQRPVAVFNEVRRVLKLGGPFVVSYSNRCFPTKATAIWRAGDLRSHAALVHDFLQRAQFADVSAHVLANGMHGDPLVAIVGRA